MGDGMGVLLAGYGRGMRGGETGGTSRVVTGGRWEESSIKIEFCGQMCSQGKTGSVGHHEFGVLLDC